MLEEFLAVGGRSGVGARLETQDRIRIQFFDVQFRLRVFLGVDKVLDARVGRCARDRKLGVEGEGVIGIDGSVGEERGELREEGEGKEGEERGELEPGGSLLRFASLLRSRLLSTHSAHIRAHADPSRPVELRVEPSSSSTESSAAKLRSSTLPEEKVEQIFGRQFRLSATIELLTHSTPSREGGGHSTVPTPSTSSRVGVGTGLIVNRSLVSVREYLESFRYHCAMILMSHSCENEAERTLERFIRAGCTVLVGMESQSEL